MQISKSLILGIIGAALVIIGCFLPWTFHADVNEYFTGFYSKNNLYGRPGKYLIIFTVVVLIGLFVQKYWAKGMALFVAAFSFAYSITAYVRYSSCYKAYCPSKQIGLFLTPLGCFLLLIAIMISERAKTPATKKA
jgi:hypothetical protein